MLSIKNLTKIYKIKGGNDTVALDNVSIEFPEKGMVFLLGKSGSGKSTLLNLIGGLDFPTNGEIILKGRSSRDFSQSDFDSYRNTYIGFIFQEYNILNEFNVEQNIALAIELQGKKVTKDAVDKLLEQVDLTGYNKRKPNTLSGGQKQRIAIARALIKEPNIIMADEPTGALDSKTGEQVFETLKKLSSDKLVIVVSHDRDFAERFGDRIIELKDGKILSDQSKHYVEATSISDNVTIINEHAIKINDAKKLTKKDFDKLYESIKNSEGKIFISSGENADKSMKVSRISDDGRSDEFKQTDKIELKQYDASKTTFIRSKMPVSKSTKMGLSSLKTKPVRLIFTMLLSVISFTMFGVASGLMLYSPNHTYSQAYRDTDYTSETLSKYAKGKIRNQHIDAYGNVLDSYVYESTQIAGFGSSEVDELNKNNLGLVYIPGADVDRNVSFSYAEMKTDADFYGTNYRLSFVSDASKEQFDKLHYQLHGDYPQNKDEVLLSKAVGQMLVDSKIVAGSNYLDAIGKKISISFPGGQKKVTVSGLFDAEDVPHKYFEIKNEETTLSIQEIDELKTAFSDYFRNSFNSVVFVNNELFEKLGLVYSRDNGRYRYVEPEYRRGVRFGDKYQMDYSVSEQEYATAYTEDTLDREKDYFTFYSLNDDELENVSFNEKEVYVSESYLNDVGYATERYFYQTFLSPNEITITRYMPKYFAYYLDYHETVRRYQESLWTGERNYELYDFYKQYEEEFDKGYKIDRFLNEYMSSPNFNLLSNEQRELLNKASNTYNGQLSESEVNEIYNILYANFDQADACKNYLPYMYLNDAYQDRDDIRDDVNFNHSELIALMHADYRLWTEEETSSVISYLNEKCPDGTDDIRSYASMLRGYTFKTFVSVPEETFKCDKNIKLYYRDWQDNIGAIDVVGYFTAANDKNYQGIFLKKSYFENISLEVDNRDTDTSYWVDEFISSYKEASDVRYTNVKVKTHFTEAEITRILKTSNKNYTLRFTSARYERVSFIVELISVLKNIFLWTGVGFGVFAALMMLNFITISIASKKKDIGILRAIGARKSDVFKIFFAESLFIATVCIVLSLGFTFIAEFFLDRYFIEQITISILQFSFATVGLVVAVALIISVIATIIPVLHSSKKPPVESIRAL